MVPPTEKISIKITISSMPRLRNRPVTRPIPASSAPVLMVTVMNAPIARTKKNTWTAPARSPLLYGPVFPGGVTISAGTCLPAAVPQAAWPFFSRSGLGFGTTSNGVRTPYRPLTGDTHRSYSRSWKDRSSLTVPNVPGTGLGGPPSQLT